MPDDLIIEDVKISPPRLEEPDRERGERQQWVDIAITVRNTSTKTTYYAISSLRQLRYDKASKVLELGLSEPDLLPGELRRFAPSQMAVEPNKTAVIQLSVPMIIHNLVPSEGLGMKAEAIDISDVKQVKCEIACHKTPFYPKPGSSSQEMVKQLRAWGKIVEKKFDRQLPIRESQEGGQKDALD